MSSQIRNAQKIVLNLAHLQDEGTESILRELANGIVDTVELTIGQTTMLMRGISRILELEGGERTDALLRVATYINSLR